MMPSLSSIFLIFLYFVTYSTILKILNPLFSNTIKFQNFVFFIMTFFAAITSLRSEITACLETITFFKERLLCVFKFLFCQINISVFFYVPHSGKKSHFLKIPHL